MANTTRSKRHPWRHLLALVGALSAAVALVCLPLVAEAQAANTRAPGGRFNDPVVRSIDVAEPAIVRLATLYNAHIALQICGQVVTLPAGGHTYLTGGLGSGAFISANGDILTADHVINIPKADLDNEIFQSQQPAQDIANVINANAGCLHISGSVAAADVANGIVPYLGIPYQTAYSSPQLLAWQDTAYTGPTSSASSQDLLQAMLSAPHQTATLEQSSSFSENDLAIIHVNLTDTPSIQLDDSAAVAVDDPLTIIGFPGNGDANTDSTDLLTPSVNNITVSAIKTNQNGGKLIQVGGNVEHGDSGGPALDTNGHIVGVVSFGGSDTPDGTSFLRSTNDATALVSTAGINVKPGVFQKLWQQAFSDYAATYSGHWRKAAQELDSLSNAYPDFKGVTPYKAYADQAATTELVNSSPTQTILLAVMALALLVILALALIVFLLLRRRNARRTLALARANQPAYSAGYPYPGQNAYPGYGSYGNYGMPAASGAAYTPYAQPDIYRPFIGGNGATASAEQRSLSGAPNAVNAPAQPNAHPAEQPQALTLRDVAADSPKGQMPPISSSPFAPNASNPAPSQAPVTVPSPTRGPGQPGFSGYPNNGGASASPVASVAWPPSGPAGMSGTSMGNVGATPLDHTLNQRPAAPAAQQTMCMNGHPMMANEVYCALCGAQRRPANPSSGASLLRATQLAFEYAGDKRAAGSVRLRRFVR